MMEMQDITNDKGDQSDDEQQHVPDEFEIASLIEHRADVNINGGVPLAFATVCRASEIADYLISHGAEPDGIEEDALRVAIRCQRQRGAGRNHVGIVILSTDHAAFEQ